MATADWRDKVTPTAQEVAEARARDRGEGLVAALVRTAAGAVFTLAEEGIDLQITRGTLSAWQHMEELWPFAVAMTEKYEPGTRAHMAAQLLWLTCTLFRHWSELADKPVRPD